LAKVIQIVTWDIPYPANYGGIIDVYYTLAQLHKAGVKIVLHAFKYGLQQEQVHLNSICEKVYYYDRKSYWKLLGQPLPFIVASRLNKDLLNNLASCDYPILFEGIHTTGYTNHPLLANHHKIIRTQNTEFEYYAQLANYSKNIFSKLYYKVESKRLLKYESQPLNAAYFLHVGQQDDLFFRQSQSASKHVWMPSFHGFSMVESLLGSGEYILYHGNLAIAENDESAIWLIKNVLHQIKIPLVIAGSNPSSNLLSYKSDNLMFKPNLPSKDMLDLIKNAHIHVLPSFQNTGLKLKLLHALYLGRHVLVNEAMLNGTTLQNGCIVANTKDEFANQINRLEGIMFNQDDFENRIQNLKDYNMTDQVNKLIDLL
jgi:hypothetical protein